MGLSYRRYSPIWVQIWAGPLIVSIVDYIPIPHNQTHRPNNLPSTQVVVNVKTNKTQVLALSKVEALLLKVAETMLKWYTSPNAKARLPEFQDC